MGKADYVGVVVSRRLCGIGLAALLSACIQSPRASPTGAIVATTASPPAATSEPSLQPSPSPIAKLVEEDLPNFSLEDERPTAVCDQDPSDAYADGRRSPIFCYDGLDLGFRALRTRMPSVERLYLHRGACAAIPCTPVELDKVEVIGWHGTDAYTVLISSDPSFITVPVEGAAAEWPTAASSSAPAVDRPAISGGAREVNRREPYPHCGRERSARSGQSSERKFEINRCFFDGVLDGRPVEMIMITDVTHEPVLLRFDGHGFVTRYMQYGTPEDWYRDEGPVILGGSVFFGLSHDAAGVRIE